MSLKDLSARLCLLFTFVCLGASAQSVTNFLPQVGTTNDTISITGTGFGVGTKIYFWPGVLSPKTNIISTTSLTAVVPSGVTTGPIGVQNGTGTINYESFGDFLVVDKRPYVSGFSPNYGIIGQNIIIGGVHFSNSPVGSVRFNNKSATFTIDQFGTNITAAVPSGATNGLITVSNNFGVYTNPNTFTVVGSGPYIASFSPYIGTGSAGQAVDLTGLHFTGTTKVLFNGTNATFDAVTSDTALRTYVPANAMSGPLTVSNASGGYTTLSNFYLPPSVTSFVATNGRTGSNIVIMGRSFLNASSVTFNALAASSFTYNSPTQITAVVPTNATTGPIRVVGPAGTSTPSANFIVVPTITSFTPGFGPVGTSVTISGANLNVGSPTVTFSGASPVAGSGATFSSLTAVVPAGATNGTITVTTSDGSATSTQLFYLPATLNALTPTTGVAGTSIKLTGNNLIGATAVYFNGAAAMNFTVSNNTTIGATAPSGVTSGPMSVVTPAGTALNTTLIFYAPPSITSFLPTHGLPGTNVTITGSSFTNATAVLFNGTNAASFTVVNNSTITAVVSNGTTTGPITVIAPGGTNTSAGNFTIDTTDLGVTVTDSPDPVFVGSNLVYTVVIANNGPNDVPNVRWTNRYPSSVTLKTVTTSAGSMTTNVNPMYGLISTLANGGSATITVTVVPTNSGTITNIAWVSSDFLDPNLINNTNSATTTVWPLPLLSIQNLGTNILKISWPAPLSNFTLQYKGILTTNVAWTNFTNARTITSSNVFVTDTNLAPVRFYRLTN